MTLAERYQDLETKANEAWSKRDDIRKVWVNTVAKAIYPEDLEKIQLITVSTHSYLDDDATEKNFSVEFKLGDYAFVTLRPNKHFRISTTGYSYSDDESGDVLERLRAAGEMHSLMMTLIESDHWYNYCKEMYTSIVLNNEDYHKADTELQDIHKQQVELKKQIQEEDRIKRDAEVASMRIKGQLLLYKGPRPYSSKERRLELNLVTQVTPQKIRVAGFGFYLKEGETFDEMLERGLQYINQNKEYLLNNKSGDFYKNETLASSFEIFNRDKF